jgi:endonuclease/exonuclease/phosphatase family metal-dependent hydrolase
VVLLGIVCVAATIDARQDSSQVPSTGADLLTFDELLALASKEPPQSVAAKLDALLAEPLMSDGGLQASTRARSPLAGDSSLRVAFWNIERGRELALVRMALTDPSNFRREVSGRRPLSARRWTRVAQDLSRLRDSDIVVLNEVDFGMKRTGYANVAARLADAFGMRYVYGIEFVEVDRLYTGEERIPLDDPGLSKLLEDDLRVDPARYLGLHGSAILSRLPLRETRIYRLQPCYDWFQSELDGIAGLEEARRWSAKKVFEERIRRQVRRGGRMALIAEVDLPAAPGGAVTIVATHLEDRSTPACRREQVSDLLRMIQPIAGMVVLAGDLNTSGGDGTPTSIRREVMKRVSNPRFWQKQAVRWFSPVAVPSYILWPFAYWKNLRDPTAISIRLLAPNRERGLFNTLRDFRFADGVGFDFSGSSARSGNGRSGTLANSNERAWKGFRATYQFERRYFGLVGEYRLDWILVKPGVLSERRRGLPGSPHVLRHLNDVIEDQLSDHRPMTVDVSLE